jgi:hypothetical protein
MTDQPIPTVGFFFHIPDSPTTIGIEVKHHSDNYNFQDVSEAIHHFLTVRQGFGADTFIITRQKDCDGTVVVEFVNEGIVMAKLIDYIE